MCDQATVEGVAEDLGECLVVERKPLRLQSLDNVGIAQALLCLQLKGQADELALFIGLYHLLPVHLILVISHGCLSWPVAFPGHGQHARRAALPALVVVHVPHREVDALHEHAHGRGGVHWLGDGQQRDAQLTQPVGDEGGAGARAGEAVVAVDDDVADIVAALLHEVEHPLELLPLVGLGALVGAAEFTHHLIAVALGVGAATVELCLQALVRLGLLFC
ncbi:hypothetical protein LN893_14850 [Pontibacter sp. XAAS-A31]|nr:hypothetical protein [Pontibacter harenae]MCC9168123.1 hypothetical protein [Pontibacter harenae]